MECPLLAPRANRAYEQALEFRSRDVSVVMSGIHAAMCAEENLPHVGAVFCLRNQPFLRSQKAMDKLANVKFSGKSGARYAFEVYPLEAAIAQEFAGVYVVTLRREGKSKSGFVHRRMGTGRSDDLPLLPASDGQSYAARGANCICLHAETDSDARLKIEQDLIRIPQAGNA